MSVPLHFIHISDTHIHPDLAFKPHYAPRSSITPLVCASALVDQIRALPFQPDFILHTGDVVSDPVLDYYGIAADVFASLSMPVYFLPGNHDHPRGTQRLLPPAIRPVHTLTLDYEFECGGVQIVCLDTASQATDHTSRLTEQQLAWIEKISMADEERTLVIALHHPVVKVGIPWVDDRMRLLNGEALHTILLNARHRLRGVFFGHIHQNTETLRDGIFYSSVQSSWYQLHAYPDMSADTIDDVSQPGFSVVTITAQQTFIRRHSFPVTPHLFQPLLQNAATIRSIG